MGGSEYFENYPHNMGGRVPKVHLGRDQIHGDVILKLIESKVTNCVHDCSKGGLAVSLVELALNSDIGISVELERIPNNCSRLDYLLFSESHSRYLFTTKNPDQAADILRIQGCIYAKIGYATGYNSQIQLKRGGKVISEIPLNDARRSYENLNIVMAGSDER
jgi:phosphoribosylformylglycinamidine synthase